MKSGFESKLNENIFEIGYEPKQLSKSILLDRIEFNFNYNDQQRLNNMDIIFCNSNLGNCLLAFLDDCFTPTTINDHDKKVVMKLNPLLVPFKLAINIDSMGCKAIGQRKLLEVAQHLIDLLEEHSETITIFPFASDNPITIDQ